MKKEKKIKEKDKQLLLNVILCYEVFITCLQCVVCQVLVVLNPECDSLSMRRVHLKYQQPGISKVVYICLNYGKI